MFRIFPCVQFFKNIPPSPFEKIMLDRRRILNINYRLLGDARAPPIVRKNSDKIVWDRLNTPRTVHEFRSSIRVDQFIRSYPIIAEPIRTSPDSIHSIPRISSTSLHLLHPLLLLSYFYRRYPLSIFEILPFYFLLIFSFFVFFVFFLFFFLENLFFQ